MGRPLKPGGQLSDEKQRTILDFVQSNEINPTEAPVSTKKEIIEPEPSAVGLNKNEISGLKPTLFQQQSIVTEETIIVHTSDMYYEYTRPIKEEFCVEPNCDIVSCVAINCDSTNAAQEATQPRPKVEKIPLDKAMNDSTKAYCIACGRRQEVRERKASCKFCLAPVRYRCEDCRSWYKTRNSLKMHIQNKHVDKDVVFECRRCSSCLSTRKLLQQHEQYCGVDKQVRCNFCDHVTKHASNMRSHVLSKHTDTELVCDRCDKRYTSVRALGRHRRLYCGKEKQFKCAHCAFRAFRKDQMPVHLRRKHRRMLKLK